VKRFVALCFLAAAALPAFAPAAGAAGFDDFDRETVNDRDPFGREVPYDSAEARQFTVSFPTADFGLQPGEGDEAGNLNGCVKPGGVAVFAGRTGWVRFNPGVDGRLSAVAQTGYDSVVWIREAREAEWMTQTFSDVRGRDNNCSDLNEAAGDEQTELHAAAANAYYVQVGGKCPEGRASCSDPSVPGGPTTLRLTFVPDDSDGDGVADTREGSGCQGQGARGAVTADGCADTDHDAIRDDQEGPGCVGQAGVPADPPYNGCFAGPDPPRSPGGASVVISSVTGDYDNTTSVDVTLHLNWPKGAREAFANNSAGDPEQRIELKESVPWRLRPAGKSETREVEVRFAGPGLVGAKDEDTITLDATAPRMGKTLVVKTPGRKRWFVGFGAQDDRGGTGVETVNVLDRRQRVIAPLDVCSGSQCKRKVVDDVKGLRRAPRFVQAVDAAGNLSKPKRLARASRLCRITVPMGGYRPKCFKVGRRCRRKNPPFWHLAGLQCKKHRITRLRRR
jgi:hypothetical protein